MKDLLAENRRLQSQVERLTDENMNLVAVIRTLRRHLREDNAKLDAYRQLDCVAVDGCKSSGEARA